MTPVEILVTDPISDEGLAALKGRNGFRLVKAVKAEPGRLKEALKTADALLIRSETKVTEALLADAPRLKLIGRAGVGVDNVDLDAASRRGIVVMNVPGGNTLAAAEHAWALLLSLSRNVAQADASMKAGGWERSKLMGSELSGKTLGVVGLGRIGREVARRGLAFNMKVLGFDPFLTEEQFRSLGAVRAELETVFKEADYVSLHASLTDKTKKLADRRMLALMKPGARLVNCARGELVDEEALLEALRGGKLRGAALDVYSAEPLPADSPLRKEPKLVLTPHLGASTEEAQLKVAVELSEAVAEFFERGTVRNAVNLPGFDSDAVVEVGPYLELSERLGRFMAQLMTGGLKKVKLHLAGAYEPKHRRPIAVSALKGLLASFLDRPGISWVNAPLLAEERGIRVVESCEDSGRSGFNRLVVLEVETESGLRSVAGTVLPGGELRLTRFGGLSVDVILDGKMLVLRNMDAPGLIGRVGTILGEARVNIADMRVGRASVAGEAAMVITVDQPVPEPVLERLKSAEGVKEVHWVEL